MKDRSDDPAHHERTLLPRSYISLPHNSDDCRHHWRFYHVGFTVGFCPVLTSLTFPLTFLLCLFHCRVPFCSDIIDVSVMSVSVYDSVLSWHHWRFHWRFCYVGFIVGFCPVLTSLTFPLFRFHCMILSCSDIIDVSIDVSIMSVSLYDSVLSWHHWRFHWRFCYVGFIVGFCPVLTSLTFPLFRFHCMILSCSDIIDVSIDVSIMSVSLYDSVLSWHHWRFHWRFWYFGFTVGFCPVLTLLTFLLCRFHCRIPSCSDIIDVSIISVSL